MGLRHNVQGTASDAHNRQITDSPVTTNLQADRKHGEKSEKSNSGSLLVKLIQEEVVLFSFFYATKTSSEVIFNTLTNTGPQHCINPVLGSVPGNRRIRSSSSFLPTERVHGQLRVSLGYLRDSLTKPRKELGRDREGNMEGQERLKIRCRVKISEIWKEAAN